MEALLRIASCQAPNADAIGRAVAEYLRSGLGVAVEWVDGIPWQERYAQLERSEVHLCWICGAPYVRLRERGVAVELAAAPVFRGARYGGSAVYFSDVVVRKESAAQGFADLRGCHWGYNERGSLSGYECVRGALLGYGGERDFFGRVTEAGSHENALRLIRSGAIDAAAIDTTVLEEEVRQHPEIAAEIRVVHTIGPSPMPPWVTAPGVDAALRVRVRERMTTMRQTPEGRRALAATAVARYAAVVDADYDPVRTLLAATRHVRL